MAQDFTVNSAKAGYSGSNVQPPGAFTIDSLVMTNSLGLKKDLRDFAESFVITSELFSPVATLSVNIRDNGSFFSAGSDAADTPAGDFTICGQETIDVEISRSIANKSAKDRIKHRFFVKEYPNYTKTLDFANVQFFTLLAVSDYAYNSSLMNICRPVDEDINITDNIKNIFINDLLLPPDRFKIDGENIIQFTGLINIQRPLKAAEFLRSRCFDIDGSPFFLYCDASQGDGGLVCLSSWTKLTEKEKIADAQTYVFSNSSQFEPGTQEHTDQERGRILSMTSNIKYDRLASANSGAYAGRLNITDYATLSYYTIDALGLPIEPEQWAAKKYKTINDKRTPIEETLYNTPSTYTRSLAVNTAPSQSNRVNSVSASLPENIMRANAILNRLSESTHEISVYGNAKLNPGTVIKLKVPRLLSENSSPADDVDLSGNFLILVSVHSFSQGIYSNKLQLAKITKDQDFTSAFKQTPVNRERTGIIADGSRSGLRSDQVSVFTAYDPKAAQQAQGASLSDTSTPLNLNEILKVNNAAEQQASSEEVIDFINGTNVDGSQKQNSEINFGISAEQNGGINPESQAEF